MKASELTPAHIGAQVAIKWEDESRYAGVLNEFSARASSVVRTADGTVAAVVLDIRVEIQPRGRRGATTFTLDGSEEVVVL